MRYKLQSEDFIVEESISLPLESKGSFAICRVHKHNVTTLSVRREMARVLGIKQSAVVFPALKDKDAVSVQYAAVRGTVPAQIEGRGFEAQFVGRSSRPLGPGDIVANRFTIVLRDLTGDEVLHIQARKAQVARFGLPNYFDQQRFGSLRPGEDHIAKRILQRDAEGGLRAYLSQPFIGDPRPVRDFKTFAAENWGNWDALFDAAPRPSNYRSVLTYLRDHPQPTETEQRKALNLINRRLLSIYLSAYQSLLWNRIVARYLEARLGDLTVTYVEIAEERLPLYHELPPGFDHGLLVALPNHRAIYPDEELKSTALEVLAEEGFEVNDLKARILKKAYLYKGKRALLLFPQGLSTAPPESDDLFPGKNKLTLDFTLPRGSYATLVIKALSPIGP